MEETEKSDLKPKTVEIRLKNNSIEGIKARVAFDKVRMNELSQKILTLSALLDDEVKHIVALEKYSHIIRSVTVSSNFERGRELKERLKEYAKYLQNKQMRIATMSDRIKKLVSKSLADFVKEKITEMDGYCKNWEITRKAEAAHSKNSDPKVAAIQSERDS